MSTLLIFRLEISTDQNFDLHILRDISENVTKKRHIADSAAQVAMLLRAIPLMPKVPGLNQAWEQFFSSFFC